MTKFIKQVFISIDALSLMIYVYYYNCIAKGDINVNMIIDCITNQFSFCSTNSIYIIMSIICFALMILISYIILKLCTINSSDNIDDIPELKEVTNEYMSIYLGYIFVAVSIDNAKTFTMIFMVLLIILCKTQIIAFNPMFCLLGYHYYKIKISQNAQSIEIFVMSKRKNIKDYKKLTFQNLVKINEFTYIDKGE